jgi:hypothetical protein
MTTASPGSGRCQSTPRPASGKFESAAAAKQHSKGRFWWRSLAHGQTLASETATSSRLTDQDAIFENPPVDADAFVDAVLAEGGQPDRITKAERRPTPEIVTRHGVWSED